MNKFKIEGVEPKELALLSLNKETEEVVYIDLTRIELVKCHLYDWINLTQGKVSEDIDGVFGFMLGWGANAMNDTTDGKNIVRVMNQILADNGASALIFDSTQNAHFSHGIKAGKIEDILKSSDLSGVKERMRAHDFKLMVR